MKVNRYLTAPLLICHIANHAHQLPGCLAKAHFFTFDGRR